jgi:hypothetical protein
LVYNSIKMALVLTAEASPVSYTDVGTTYWIAPNHSVEVEYLVVGGGGGGGNGHDTGAGGGGGGGMVRTATGYSITPNQVYTITVGSGGSGGADTRETNNGTPGENSIFSTITSLGG